jgi:FecR protein
MTTMWKSAVGLIAGLFAAGVLTVANAAIARPGMVNYVEGNVKLNGQVLGASTIGSAEVGPGQVLETGAGKAEMLLTPGAFLRIGDNSAVKMITPSLTDTEVELQRGQANLEVDRIEKWNRLEIVTSGITTTLKKKGIYQFDADRARLEVFDGEAVVHIGDRDTEVWKGKELALVATADKKPKPRSFDRNQPGELYAWSKVRSEYMAEASQASAQNIMVDNLGWYGDGWYWNPWFDSWAFVPAYGYGFYGPFGFGFYGPGYFGWGGPWYGGWGHRGYGGYGRIGGFGGRGAFGGRGFAGGFHGGGFGGGGFHGGGGGHR